MFLNFFNSDFILREKRYSWIDYDKGISIILVAYGHCLTLLGNSNIGLENWPVFRYVGLFLYGFRMPLFFIISGVFLAGSLSRKGLGGYIYGRTNNVLYPLVIWGCLEVALHVLSDYHRTHVFQWEGFLNLFVHPRAVGIGQFWYLNALFSIGVIYAILKVKLRLGLVPQLVLGLAFYCLSAYWHVNDIEMGMLTDVCAFYIWFSLGAAISTIVLDEKNVRRFASLKIFFPLALIFICLQYYCTSMNLAFGHGDAGFVENKKPFLYLIEALTGCILSVNISFQLQKHKIVRFLRVVGFHSLFIYVMQIVVMTIVETVLIKVLKVRYVPVVVVLLWVSGVIIPISIYNMCLRFNMWWLFTFIKPEKEIAAIKGGKASVAGSKPQLVGDLDIQPRN
jgi:fucose 4-O-acetylase-like acetyltransferase